MAEEPGGLQSMGCQRVGHDLVTKQQQHAKHAAFNHFKLDSKRVGHDLVTKQQQHAKRATFKHSTLAARRRSGRAQRCVTIAAASFWNILPPRKEAAYPAAAISHSSPTPALVSVHTKSLSRVRLCVTPWIVALQAPPSMGFSRPEYWSGCLALLQGIFPPQESNPCLLCLLRGRRVLYH